MSDFHKCTCPHCGQKIEYPADGMGQSVPCPTCEKSFTLSPDVTIPPAKALEPAPTQTSTDQSPSKSEWDEWIALNQRLMERRIKSGIPISDESTLAQPSLDDSQGFGESGHKNKWAELFALKKQREQPVDPLTEKNVPPAIKATQDKDNERLDKNSSRFASLTAETIRIKFGRIGNTPLHQAARLGKISEIPCQLLTNDLFMATNNHPQKHTPIHVAAQYGQLDKVPRRFLNKVTMTASSKYGAFPWVPARGETPLHLAVRCGYADQIPKKFFKPKYLSIVATRVNETVLHELAYARKLDLVPKIYGDSPMWDLKNAYGQTPREIIETGLDAKTRPSDWKLWKPPASIMPEQDGSLTLLPVFTHESLKAIKVRSSSNWNEIYLVNLLDYTCTCPQCSRIHSTLPPRDFGRLCEHVITTLREKHLVSFLPPIARGIAENGYPKAFGVSSGCFANDRDGNLIYVCPSHHPDWISVYALWRRGGVNYRRFGYNIKTKAWSFTNRDGVNAHRIVSSDGNRMISPKPNIDEDILH